MAKKSKPYRICIEDKEDRQTVAGILVKNGYQVRPGKQFKVGSRKSYDYYVEVLDTMGRDTENATTDSGEHPED